MHTSNQSVFCFNISNRQDMRLIFVLLVFLPALIYGRPMDEEEPTASEDSSESGDGKPMDEDKPSNSNEDHVTAADLSDYSEPKEKPSIHIRPSDSEEDQENEKILDLGDFIESGEGEPVDEDEPSNSKEDKEKTTDLSDSSKLREGKGKEISEDEELGRKDCDGPVTSMISQGLMTEKGCVCTSDAVSCPTWKCNVHFCACKIDPNP